MKKNTIRIFCVLLSAVFIFSAFTSALVNAAFSKENAEKIYKSTDVAKLTSKAYSLLDVSSGKIIYKSENADARFTVGNMVKIMTLYLTMEAITNGQTSYGAEFSVTKSAQNISVGRERVFLDAGKNEKITVEQALTAVAICGANDAAYALSEHICINEAEFVIKMNQKAQELGLTNTKFIDCTGITTDTQYSSANDMAMLSYHLVKDFPAILDFTAQTYGMFEHTSTGQESTQMVSSNNLIRKEFYKACDGLICGYSRADGYAQSATAKADDRRLVAVVIGADSEDSRAAELKKLMEYGFSDFEYRVVDAAGTFVRKVNIKKGKSLKLKTATAEDFSLVLNINDIDKVEREIIVNDNLTAPVGKGDQVGSVVYKLNGEEVGSVALLADEDVKKANWFTLFIRWILEKLGVS